MMVDPDALLRSGDVDAARAALVDIVRSRPADEQARMFLFQLLCVLGEWGKAGKQLEILAQVAGNAQMLMVTYNQAIEAEQIRADVFDGKIEMPVLVGMGGWIDSVAQAITLQAQGKAGEAKALRDSAFAQAPDTPGEIAGNRFDFICDADLRFGPAFEAIIAGRYGIVPFEAVQSITSDGPQDLRDTVWYPVQIALRSGQSVAAFLPARYPGTDTAASQAVRLGRETVWNEQPWGQAGLGQRIWSLSDGTDIGLLDLRHISFD